MNVSHFAETASPQLFPQLIDLLRPFPAVRYMNWQQINHLDGHSRPYVRFVNDLPVVDLRWLMPRGPWGNYAGAPLDAIAVLASVLNHRPWVCVPHAARAEVAAHIVQTFVKRGVRPILQYSNEVWNSAFEQHKWCADQYALTQQTRAANVLGDRTAALLWECEQANWMANAFHQHADVVVGAQFWAPETVELVLDHVNEDVHAIAVAPYLGRNLDAGELDNAQIEHQLMQEIGDVRDLAGSYVDWCSKANKLLFAYEGGLHLTAYRNDGQTDIELADVVERVADFNRSAEAGAVTAALWEMWIDEGGDVACPYSAAVLPSNQFFGHAEITGGQIVVLPKHAAVVGVLGA